MKTMIFLSAIVGAILSAQPVEVSLWTDEFPQPDKIEDKEDAKIFIHHPVNPNGTAAIICPGGGYRGQVMGAEGHGIAEWLGKYTWRLRSSLRRKPLRSTAPVVTITSSIPSPRRNILG